MSNNARTGFTLQKLICEKYNIVPKSSKAIAQFNSSFDATLKNEMDGLIGNIFNDMGKKPIECTTFDRDDNNKDVPYNFILDDNSTLSVRTNITGDKVAPRIVGQAGFDKLNLYFSNIYGTRIDNQDDIKKMIIDKIDLCLPIFVDHLFDADYILWIYSEDNKYKYHLLKGDTGTTIEYDKSNFSFTRGYSEWIESTTLKYKGISIAEIQTHKNRSFKFRFIMNNIIPFFIDKEKNTETLGMTAEKAICDMFDIEYPNNFFKRYSVNLQYQIQDAIQDAFNYLPKPIKHMGSTQGVRGGNSKCSYDFLLLGNKTLSLKTNMGKMVCPPEVGQPNDKTAYLYFKDYADADHIDKDVFKKMVYNHIADIIPIYLQHMFDSDYLLRIFEDKAAIIATGTPYSYEIYPKCFGHNFKWDKTLFSFSKQRIEEWNESNTLYYDGKSIGEFQVHNHRNCYKFRFNFRNLTDILNNSQ